MNLINSKKDRLYKDTFIATVCTTCGFCQSPNPEFCRELFDHDPVALKNQIVPKLECIRYLGLLSGWEENNITALESPFLAFVDIFCTKKLCPFYEIACDDNIDTQVKCYSKFLKQSGIELSLSMKSNIYNKWSGISMNDLESDYDHVNSEFLKLNNNNLSKSQRKKLRKRMRTIGKKISKLKSRNVINNKTRSKPKKAKHIYNYTPETTVFHNSNNDWEQAIKYYLYGNKDGNQDNNRQ